MGQFGGRMKLSGAADGALGTPNLNFIAQSRRQRPGELQISL